MLRIFGQLKNVCLEVYGSDDNTEISRKYAKFTKGDSIEKALGFIDRAGKSWKNQFRIYFDAEDWVIESLRKLGIAVLDTKSPESIIARFGKKEGDCEYVINNVYWFWKIVEYGYKVGGNDTITWDEYQASKK